MVMGDVPFLAGAEPGAIELAARGTAACGR
jgi:hypothetical protein